MVVLLNGRADEWLGAAASARLGWKGAVAVTTGKRPLAGPSPDIRTGVVHKPSHLIVFDRPGGAKEAFMPLDRRGFIIRAPSP